MCPSRGLGGIMFHLHHSSAFLRVCRLSVLLTLLLGLCSVNVRPQVTSGTISGTVKDSSGAVVAKAKVTVASAEIGLVRSANSSADGGFVFPNLQPATYKIVVEADGFKKSETTGVVLSAAAKLDIGDLVLQVGSVGASVTVSA